MKAPSTTDHLGRVVFLTNFIPPYRRAALLEFAKLCGHLTVLVSTDMEANRSWTVDWEFLHVVQQSTITFAQRWHHPNGSDDRLYVHLPLDTIGQLREAKPAVVISAEMGFRTMLAIVFRKLYGRTRLLIWADVSESSEAGRGAVRRLSRNLLRRGADGFITNSKSGARYLQSVGVPETNIALVPYATDAASFAVGTVDRSPFVQRRLLYAGQLLERKGLLPFLSTLADWAAHHPDELVEFTIVGSGPLRTSLAAFEGPVNLRLHLQNAVPYEQLRSVYENAGVFVFPTLADTWGLVVNEALATGLPVLGSIRSPAVEELIKDGENGFTFDPIQRQSTYAAIERLFEITDSELNRMRIAARASALRLAPPAVARSLRNAVEQLVHCGGGRPVDRTLKQERAAWS